MSIPFSNPAFECLRAPDDSKIFPYYAEGKTLVTFIDESVYQKISEHANSDTKNEVGGALLGKYCIDLQVQQRFLLVTDVFPATAERNDRFASPVLMRFTHTFFRKLDEYLDIIHDTEPNTIRLGMYHSHPGYGVFMSTTDISTFREIFLEPWHISLIVDPINNDAGVFYWQEDGGNKEISQKSGFSLFKLKNAEQSQLALAQDTTVEHIAENGVDPASNSSNINNLKTDGRDQS